MMLSLLLGQLRYQPGPTSLVAGAKPGAVPFHGRLRTGRRREQVMKKTASLALFAWLA
jgi:hypothetical protein